MIDAKRSLIVPVAGVCLLLTACFGFETMIFEDIVTETEGIAVDLKSNLDPEVQAAAASSSAIADQKKARQSMQTALDNNQLDAALAAVELRPGDPYFRVQFAGLLLANGDVEEAKAEARVAGDLLDEQGVGVKERARFATQGLLEVRDSFEPGSEQWERVHKDYCVAVRRYVQETTAEPGKVFDSIFDVVEFSQEGCP